MLHLEKHFPFFFISWREAHSSTGRLVTGTGMVQRTKLSITRSIFELEAQNFAWNINVFKHGSNYKCRAVRFIHLSYELYIYHTNIQIMQTDTPSLVLRKHPRFSFSQKDDS